MKLGRAALILAGIFCMSAYTRADTTLPSTISDAAQYLQYAHPSQAHFFGAWTEYRRAFNVGRKFESDDNLPATGTTSDLPAIPTPEPSGFVLVGSGLLSLLGLSQIKSLRRFPWAS